ncbi:glycosyltransferase family 2 protein [Natronoglycomyces albus]|uniref:Glycosyltransferase family 2 protein n=1 Tax=Natronoglycomyces albus TaxID=2811108 RepID=A0A895XPN8_9ACTN|nr:glycosyltransferase family 2 protein [Natronoglycomyces albus]QSB05065.1 glycosyltransferase family 2 protein [Natronoglycomyces albus]
MSRDRLFRHYAHLHESAPAASLTNTILRQRLTEARDVVAYLLAGEHASLSDILKDARSGRFGRSLTSLETWKPTRVTSLARLLALQAARPSDMEEAKALFDVALHQYGPSPIIPGHQAVHAQLAYELGDLKATSKLLRTYANLPEDIRLSLELNLGNPMHNSSRGNDGLVAALEALSPDGARFEIAAGDEPLFDRLRAQAQPASSDSALISVVITCFKPNHELKTAIKSILAQTWQNFEILVVDDASPSDFDALLKECEALDERIRLIKMPANGGTYVARNAALDLANGDAVTFQDSDDFSHPKRLEDQAKILFGSSSVQVVTSDALKISEDLVVRRLGRRAIEYSLPSMMFKLAAVRERIGYFHSIRKSADTEFVDRIKATYGDKCAANLAGRAYQLMRQNEGSLSRSDFGPGWMHPARVAYKSAQSLWHRRIRQGQADGYLPREDNVRLIPAPDHLHTNGHVDEFDVKTKDVIFVGDWRFLTRDVRSGIDEIAATVRSGREVGIVQVDALHQMAAKRQYLCEPLQELINSGECEQLDPTQRTRVGTLIVRDPAVVQFSLRDNHFRISAEQLFIFAEDEPWPGSPITYTAPKCDLNAREAFDIEPVWVPRNDVVRSRLEGLAFDQGGIATQLKLSAENIPWIVQVTGENRAASRLWTGRSIVGRHSLDQEDFWPDDAETLAAVYPEAHDIDFRNLGGLDTARALRGVDHLPDNWVDFGHEMLGVADFLFPLDFWVWFPSQRRPVQVEREITEALAAGVVVILPERYEPIFGHAALYADPANVKSLIDEVSADSVRKSAQSLRAQQFCTENFPFNDDCPIWGASRSCG